MPENEIIDKIKKELIALTKKSNILLTRRGNASISEVIKLAKKIGREKVLIQDQGGWITYKQFANKHGLMCIELKTDYGLTDLADLEKKADGKSIFIMNSLTGYHAEEDMKQIAEICEKKHCLLVNDISGSIGLKIASYGEIILGSFNRWKPVNLGLGGFIAFDDIIPSNYEFIESEQKFLQKVFDMKEHFKGFEEYNLKERDLEKLYEKIKDAKKRHEQFIDIQSKIKKDLKGFDIIHPDKSGINVIVKFKNDEEKSKIIKYCDDNKFEYTECPRYIRVNEKAICIEVKRL
jgi:dTDP-4-amino-4,6-dideoxygalactose transaminase